jgi:hypothetical protein
MKSGTLTLASQKRTNHCYPYSDYEGIAMIDEMIREIEEKYEVLYSDVPGSRLHEIINNPVDEGIDEG